MIIHAPVPQHDLERYARDPSHAIQYGARAATLDLIFRDSSEPIGDVILPTIAEGVWRVNLLLSASASQNECRQQQTVHNCPIEPRMSRGSVRPLAVVRRQIAGTDYDRPVRSSQDRF